MLSLPALELYWSGSFLAANAFIGLNLLGALMLGMLVGYERSYNGRATVPERCKAHEDGERR